MSQPDWSTAQNILCIRLDSLGDVLMTEPAMRAVKQSAPHRRLTLLTSNSGAEVAPLIWELDDVIRYAAPWMKATAVAPDASFDRGFIRSLARCRFDGAVIFTVFSQSALPAAMACYLADIPLRLAHCRENPYQLLTHWVRDPDNEHGMRHEVRRELDLVGTIGCTTANESMQLAVPRIAIGQAAELLIQSGIDRQGRWLVIHPGATARSRRYPPEMFACAADILAREAGFQIVFTGAPDERELIDFICARMDAPSCSLAGRLELAQLAGLITLAPLLISNNTGPAHLAAAVGTPVVDLYALTNPQHTPWQVASRVLSYDVPCKYCYQSICTAGHHDCLRRISPREVARAALDLLHEVGTLGMSAGALAGGGRWHAHQLLEGG
jgi:lipopolysaccharide heptosyltransferase II